MKVINDIIDAAKFFTYMRNLMSEEDYKNYRNLPYEILEKDFTLWKSLEGIGH